MGFSAIAFWAIERATIERAVVLLLVLGYTLSLQTAKAACSTSAADLVRANNSTKKTTE
jgi:hypothetical protein